jgi:hypothetical protein
MSKHTTRTTTIRLGAAALASAAALGAIGATAGAATPAASATPATLSGVQAKAAAAITLRVNDLNAAIAKVNGAKSLGSTAPTLAAYLQRDIVPLQQLGTTIAGDTSVAQAEKDAATIFTNFRVLALVLPAAHQAGLSDAIVTTALPKLAADSAKASAHVNASNQATLQPLITDLNAQISAAGNAVSGLAATDLAYLPAQWNANHDLLASSKSALAGAGGDLKKAKADLVQIVKDLKGTQPASTTPTTAS